MRLNSLVLLNKICSLAPVIALTCSVPIVFAVHSYFSFGVWYRAEPVIVSFHASSAVCSLALIFSWWHDRQKFIGIISHPFVLFPAALCVWIAVTAPFAQLPLLSLLGSPQLGEGALWYANLAVLIACALYVVREKHQWRFLVVWSGMIVCGIVAVKLLAAAEGTYELIWISAYLAFIGIAVPFIGLRYIQDNWRWLWLLLGGASIALLIIAKSKAAMALFVFGAGIVGIGFLFNRTILIRHMIYSRKGSMAIVELVAVLPFIVIESDLINDYPSLYSRFLVFKLMNEALSSDGFSFITGQGWGRTQDALVTNLQVAGENIWNQRWDYFKGDYLHSHNWIYEALYACGAPGVLITLLFYLSIPYFSDVENRHFATAFASVYAGISAVWFQISFSLPFVALALAALGADWRISKKNSNNLSKVLQLGPVLLAGLLFTQIIVALTLHTFAFSLLRLQFYIKDRQYI